MHNDIDNDLLRTFLTIVETGSFSRAADVLHKTQAALSLQIKRLESDLGVKLLERSTKGVYPTEAGNNLKPYAIESLKLSDTIKSVIEGKKISTVIRVGLLEDIALGALPHVMQRFIKSNPNVKIEITVSDSQNMSKMLKDRQLDIVIADRNHVDAKPSFCWQEKLVWICAYDYQPPKTGPVPVIAFGKNCPWQEQAFKALDSMNTPWEIILNSSNLSAINSAVEAGIGISFGLNYSVVRSNLRVLSTADGFADIEPVELGIYVNDRSNISDQLGKIFEIVCGELIDSRIFTGNSADQ
ncbi:LysR family transcriptional regulator [Pseudomonas oryzihabitans]|uniref:LysR family transcriptional regulator n=1 Tax=Pseudomonas oryzihabitans TaxID=47885 RepID=UPI0011231C54|nr:LysR family transcriptional regulator [Pseudomonas psychrotolerans]QDD88447.1 hypothetical protein CCZ28_05275 [Pseudomonas psychrotolerans]